MARLSLLTEEVDVRRADSGDTFAASVNTPLSLGDELTTADGSFAEVEFEYGSSLRLAPDTRIRFAQLDPNDHIAQLARGTLEIRVLRAIAAHPEIDTPGAEIRPEERGKIRITVGTDGNTELTVRDGQAGVRAGSGTQTVSAGNTVVVTGTGDAATIAPAATIPLDGFDQFNDDRDAYFGNDTAHTQGDTYVDEGLLGADELGPYGTWIPAPPYGQVWEPADQSNGWAPYHSGRYVWQPYYGWTWLASEPWGWAPYHYGNWFYNSDGRWAWSPGVYAAAQPYAYSPALVAFFGFGSGAFGSPFENIGWVPIAPGESAAPWWGYAGNGSGFAGAHSIVTVYRNVNGPSGAVSVDSGAFAAGAFTHLVALQPGAFENAHLFRGGIVPIVPTRRNLAFTASRPAPIATPDMGSAGFARFVRLVRTPQPFELRRIAVAAAATKLYPESTTDFARQLHGAPRPRSPAQPGNTIRHNTKPKAAMPQSMPSALPSRR